MSTYFTLLTKVGIAKITNAVALDTKVNWSQMVIGDGNGNVAVPNENQTQLVREVFRGPINHLYQDPENSAYVIAELIIPASVGGWTAREAGIIDTEGNLVAVANLAASYKPTLPEGSGVDLVVRMVVQVGNASSVELKIDPAIVLASRQWVIDNYVNKSVFNGGTTGQILRKKSNNDLETEWFTPDTPPQFDNDKSLATTEFVQRALGNCQSVKVVDKTTTLYVTDVGKLVQCFGDTGGNITLPPTANLAVGSKISFWSNATAVFTILRNGADTISNGVTLPTSVKIKTGDSVEFTYRGDGLWLMSGVLQLSSSSVFKVLSSVNGKMSLPGDIVIQWGTVSINPPSAVSVLTGTVVYPEAFTGNVFSVVATTRDTANNETYGSANRIPVCINVNSGSLSSFTYNLIAPAATMTNEKSFKWIAIGKNNEY